MIYKKYCPKHGPQAGDIRSCRHCILDFIDEALVMPRELRARLEKVRDELKKAIETDHLHPTCPCSLCVNTRALRMLEAILEGEEP